MTERDQKVEEFLSRIPKFDPSNAETYNAYCHCGTVHCKVTLSPPLYRHPIGSCNCSICLKSGYLLVYPTRDRVTIEAGEDNLQDYTFGPKLNHHKFCGRCGSSVLFDPKLRERGDLPDLIGVNVRMFQDVKLEKVSIFSFDGYRLHPFIGNAAHLKPLDNSKDESGPPSTSL